MRPGMTVVINDIPLNEGRTLRVGILGENLILSMGWGRGGDWNPDPAEGLILPEAVLGRLVLALLDVGNATAKLTQ